MRYIAFLRGINVGGKNIIKMENLKASFESLGFKNVKTFIQSGNVFFDSGITNAATISKKIESGLLKEYKSEIKVMVRTAEEIESMIKRNPFKNIALDEKIKLYVSFSLDNIKANTKLPVVSEKEACEIIAVEGKDIFVVSREMKNGRYGFPTIFIEKELTTYSTARNWNTVCKMMQTL